MKCNNCGYCQNHCNCERYWECGKCEPCEEEIIEEDFEFEESEHICCSKCNCWDDPYEPEKETELEEDKETDTIYCYDY